MIYKGVAGSDGIGIGKAVVIKEQNLDFSKVVFTSEKEEKQRLHDAILKFCEHTEQMAEKMVSRVGEKEAQILSGQIIMLNDPFMIEQMDEFIAGGHCAESALDTVCGMYIDMFSGVEDELTRQRATDVRDILTRTLKILLDVDDIDLSDLSESSVIIVKDLTPSMTSQIDSNAVAGIATEIGGRTSHSAILSRALEIPAVLGAENVAEGIKDGDTVIVNGLTGEVVVNPDTEKLYELVAMRDKYINSKKELEAFIGKKTCTADGENLHLYGNIGKPADVKNLIKYDGEGVGLFRTEFLFMDRGSMPSEEQQYEAYKAVVKAMNGKEVVIRTLDIGGDKDIPYLRMEKEENPFLGHRAIRYCLDRKDVFSIQLRALLRASAYGDIQIMLPLVTSVDEVRETKQLIEKLKADLTNEGKPCKEDVKIGVMIETPAAAMIADLLSKEVDFFSIGTNDLTQYVMAVDRGNSKVKELYSTFNPAVLRAIRATIKAANNANIPVGMCGESAADPLMIPLLISFGLDEYSVTPTSILSVRKQIALWTKFEADALTEKVMELTTASDIKALLEQNIKA